MRCKITPPTPQTPPVTMYLCGPTVYGKLHIGNFRNVFLFDVLYRFLKWQNYRVLYYQNITDIDDKIIVMAQKYQMTEAALSEKYYHQYLQLCEQSNLLRPQHVKVTDHILAMQTFITRLIQKNAAYVTSQGVYFDVSQATNYGLFRPFVKPQESTVSDTATTKRHLHDFALWKLTTNGQNWSSPWGNGRPGWHTECVVLINHYFRGQTLTIHGGGRDLMFPHHENEAAQFWALYRRPITRFWMHNGLITTPHGKISRSQQPDSILTMAEFLQRYNHNVIRLFFFSRPYQKDLTYRASIMQMHQQIWQRWNQLWITLHRHFILIDQENWYQQLPSATVWQPVVKLLSYNLGVDRVIHQFFAWEKALNTALNHNPTWSIVKTTAQLFWHTLQKLGFTPQLPTWTPLQKQQLQRWKAALEQRDFKTADLYRDQLQAAKLW